MLSLLKQRSFGAMTGSQFLGAFNDNAFKQVIVLLAAALAVGTAPQWVADHPLVGHLPSWLSHQSLPSFLFALPFVVFGPITGTLADRLSKTLIIRAANLLEVVVMVLATIAFYFEDYGLLLAAVFLMGTQSALFGPSKYGCIKELVGERELSRANALIQSSTMLAVLAGIFLGGVFLDLLGESLWMAGIWYITFALFGWGLSLRIEKLPAADPGRQLSWNPLKELRSHWRAARDNRNLVLSGFGSSLYYLMAATFIMVIPTYGEWLVDPVTGEQALSGIGTSVLMAMSGLGIIGPEDERF